jgi:SPOR domain
MHFVGERSSHRHLFRLNVIIAFFFIFPVFLGGACSKEEPEEVKAPKVVVRIEKPVQKPTMALPAREAAKEGPEKVESPAKSLPAPEKNQPVPPPKVKQPEKKVEREKRDGYYIVQKGDTLFKIAGRKDVYEDPLKWPSLFRINMNELSSIEMTEDFQDKEIPEGLDLRFVTSQEAARNLAKLGKKFWVINVFSSQTSKKIVPAALKLMKNGYRVYITTVTIKGKEWMRLRAGFFKNRSEATAAANKIKLVFKEDDAWIAKIGKMERERFGGY